MRQQATHRRKDLLVVDSGDLHDGNGLGDASPVNGQYTLPIYQKVHTATTTSYSLSLKRSLDLAWVTLTF